MAIKPGIEDIAYYLPGEAISNEEFGRLYPDFKYKRYEPLTGVYSRYYERDEAPVSDMAVAAAEKLFSGGKIKKEDIDFVIVVTQTGDYRLPPTACIVQDKLGLANRTGAFDINLGCSGYVNGLATAQSLIFSGVAKRVLLIAAEKHRLLAGEDIVSELFILGEAAAATVISCENNIADIGKFDINTDGSGAKYLYIPAGGAVMPRSEKTEGKYIDNYGRQRSYDHGYMDGTAIYNFAAAKAPESINAVLKKNNMTLDEVSRVILHQPSKVIVEKIIQALELNGTGKAPSNLDKVGNTSCVSIPIILTDVLKEPDLPAGSNLVLCGFGVGLSWASVVLTKK